jgi:hypothetical protein
MTDGILDSSEGSIVKERGLKGCIAERGTAELVSVRWISRHLFEAKILIFVRTIKNDVAFADPEKGSYLRNANVVHLEVAEHLVGLATDRVAGRTLSLPEENQSARFLITGHGIAVSASELVDRGVCVDLSKLKLSDGAAEHGEIDGSASRDFRKNLSEEPSVAGTAVKSVRRGYYCGFEFLIVSDIQRERIKLACEGLQIRHGQEDRGDSLGGRPRGF